MFGSRQEKQQSGTVERIGFAYTGDGTDRYVLLLEGESTPVVLRSGARIGEYHRVIEALALTMPGDQVTFALRGGSLQLFSNETLQKRLAQLMMGNRDGGIG